MSNPNKRYDRRNGNSRTVKITYFYTGQIILQSLGKLFRLIFFPKFYRKERRLDKKQANIDSNYCFFCLMCYKQVPTVILRSNYCLLPSVPS